MRVLFQTSSFADSVNEIDKKMRNVESHVEIAKNEGKVLPEVFQLLGVACANIVGLIHSSAGRRGHLERLGRCCSRVVTQPRVLPRCASALTTPHPKRPHDLGVRIIKIESSDVYID